MTEQGFRRVRVDEETRLPAPAAGADFDDAFDSALFQSGTRLLINNIYFTLVTDANAANRFVIVEIEDQHGRVFYHNTHATAITASLDTDFNLSPNIQYRDWEAVGLSVCLPIPEIYVSQNYSLTITVTNIQVGDQLSEVVIRGDFYRGVILD